MPFREKTMRPSITCSFLACAAFAFTGQAYAGFLTKDVPKKIIADSTTAKLVVTVPKALDQTANKLRSMATLCGGDKRRDEATEDNGLLIVSWMSADTVSYIIRLQPVESSTEVTVYMNANVGRQQRGWPKVLDEWFSQGTDRCIPEIMRDA